MYIPNSAVQRLAVKIWLSKTKKKYGDDWKSAVNRAIYEDQLEDIHPEVTKHLHRKKP